MESIRIWLNGSRNYAAGVKLYQIYGKDSLLKRLFKEAEVTDYKKNQLEQALIALLPAKKPAKADIPPVEVSLPVKATIKPSDPKKHNKNGWSAEMDEVEKSLYTQWKPLFSEMMDLSSRVGDIARAGQKDPKKKEEAGKMALKILDLDDQCDDIYIRRDQYLASGNLPELYPHGEPCLDPKLWTKKLENSLRYVRTFKKKLDQEPDNTEYALLIRKHQWFVDYYKEQLKMT